MTKIIPVLILLLNIGNAKKCKEITEVVYNPYIIKRDQFQRHSECIANDIMYIVNNKTKKRYKISGFSVSGIVFYDDLLQINTSTGAHTHIVYFFKIEKNGNLKAVKNGIISSDVGEPSIYTDSLKNIIVVFSRYTRDSFYYKKNGKLETCRELLEDTYEYKNSQFKKIISGQKIYSDCPKTIKKLNFS